VQIKVVVFSTPERSKEVDIRARRQRAEN